MKDLSKITNMVDAEHATIEAAQRHFGLWDSGYQKIIARQEGRIVEFNRELEAKKAVYMAEKSQWMREFLKTNFSRFSNTNIYKALVGEIVLNQDEYYYTPKAF